MKNSFEFSEAEAHCLNFSPCFAKATQGKPEDTYNESIHEINKLHYRRHSELDSESTSVVVNVDPVSRHGMTKWKRLVGDDIIKNLSTLCQKHRKLS
jgi:hypothetical protein